jgi:hypothetical protein
MAATPLDLAADGSAAPHDPQNLTPGLLVRPHAGHAIGKGLPHSAQKLRPASLSRLHDAHCMDDGA